MNYTHSGKWDTVEVSGVVKIAISNSFAINFWSIYFMYMYGLWLHRRCKMSISGTDQSPGQIFQTKLLTKEDSYFLFHEKKISLFV